MVMYNLIEVRFESLFQVVLGLAYILFTTSFACNAVGQIVADTLWRVRCFSSPRCESFSGGKRARTRRSLRF